MNSRRTIGQVLLTLELGGAEVLATRLAFALRNRYRFVFLCLDGLSILADQLSREGFPVHHVGRGSGFDPGCAWRLAALLRQEQVDLVHAHQYTPFFYSLVARRLCRRPPVLFTEHGRPFPDGRRLKRIVANRLLIEGRDRLVAVGAAVRHALISNEGLPAERVEVIYNGVDLAPLAAHGSVRQTVRAELGVGPNALLLVQVARLNALKDHGTALRTLQRVLRDRVDTHLALIGSGETQDDIEREIARLGLKHQVHLLGRRQDVARFLAAGDAFLLTSVSEGVPLTVIEAMGAGLPVVSTDVGGVREVVEDGHTGLLAPAGDAEELAKHVLALAADPARRQHMGRAGRARAEAHFSEQRNHEQYVRVYQDLLGSP